MAHLGAASGGYAERAVAPADALHAIPDGLDPAVAVAAIGTGRTALAVLDDAAITADDVVLVPAAAGGLGSLLVQAGRNAGATVVALAGGRAKVDRLVELGASVAVDSHRADWPEEVRGRLGERAPTVLLDGVGGAVGRAAFDLLGVGARIVTFGGASGELTAFTSADLAARGLTASWVIGPRLFQRYGSLRPLETRALQEAAAGRLVPLVGEPFPLADAAAAHRAIEARTTVGKVVLVP